MNWARLKEKFPKSEIEIREFQKQSGIEDSYTLIATFLKSKGYITNPTWIKALKDYELKLK